MASRPSEEIYAETLAVFDRSDRGYEPLTTPEVADALDANRRTVYKRLQKLADRGDLETKKTGSNSRVWWRLPAGSSEGESQENAGEPRQSADPERKDGSERAIFEAIPYGAALHDPADGRIVDANRRIAGMFGYTREELLSVDLEGVHAEVPSYTSERAKKHFQGVGPDEPETIEWLCQTNEGKRVPVEVTFNRTTIDGEERVLSVVREMSDVDEQGKELVRRSRAMESAIDGMAILDEQDEYIYVNETHAKIYGYDDETFIGESWQMCYGENEVARFKNEIMPTLSEEGVWRGEATGQRKDGTTFPQELSLTMTDDDCIVCVVRDITERNEREREVREKAQQLQAVLDTVEASIFLKDADGEYLLMNQNCRELVGVEEDADIVGMTDEELFGGDVANQYRADDERVFETNESIELEEEIPTPEGVKTTLTRKAPIFDDAGDPYAVCGIATDITDRKEHEKELRAARQFNEELVENAPFAMFRLDEALRITYENPRAEEIIGLPDSKEMSDAIGVDIRKLPSIVETGQADLFTRLKDGETIEFEFPMESIYGRKAYFTGRGVPLYRDGEFDGAVLMANDISERRQREQELRAAQQFNEELVENAPFGMFRLDESLRITYENPRAEEIIGLPEDRESSEAIGVDIRELPPIVATGQADIFTRLKDGETIEFEFPFESIYGKESYFTGRSVPLYRDGEFDGAVLMANDISERRQREQELEKQREQLAALDELNGVFRGITEAVIDQSTREEIEQVVCDRLAGSDSYRFAWISTTDAGKQLKPRVSAGLDSTVEDLSGAVNAYTTGPIGEAVRTQEVQITRNGFESSDRPCQVVPGDGRARSAAAIPIVHQGLLYGVLNVCSERPDAFAEEEREVIGQLGEVIGHAIAAVNRKRALMSDEVIELGFRIPGLLESLNITECGGTITFERTVPLGDEEFLLYGTATEDAREVMQALREDAPDWGETRIIDETGDKIRFEQHLSDPPLTSTIANHGGYYDTGRIENGDYTATIHLPPGTDIRQVIDDIREMYPAVEIVSQHQITREELSPPQMLEVLTGTLTERQRAALEAGYYAGFFDWPRDSSGEEVAESLNIGPSTFHQHVRKAEKKLLDVVFTS